MAATNFAASLKRVLVHEGGFSNDPRDPGGATFRGVTQRVYVGWRRRHGLPDRSVKFAASSEIEAIYRDQYWRAIRGDDLPLGLDYVQFDAAVNSGPQQAAKWLQGALRALGLYSGRIDGIVGNGTLGAVAKVNDVDALIARVCDLRLAFMRRLTIWPTFGRGWQARVDQVGDAGQDWAGGSVPADANLAYVHGMERKALVEDLGVPSAPVVAPTAGAGGGTLVVVAESLREFVDGGKEQLLPLAGTLRVVDVALLCLTYLGAAIAVGGLVYGIYAKLRRDDIEAVVDGERLAT